MPSICARPRRISRCAWTFAGGRIYEVVVDGRPLLGYAAAAQARRAEAFPELVTNSILPLFLLSLLARYAVGVWRARR